MRHSFIPRAVVFDPLRERWIRDTFTGDLPEIIDLDIPDEYFAEDPAQVAELIEVLTPVIGSPGKPW